MHYPHQHPQILEYRSWGGLGFFWRGWGIQQFTSYTVLKIPYWKLLYK